MYVFNCHQKLKHVHFYTLTPHNSGLGWNGQMNSPDLSPFVWSINSLSSHFHPFLPPVRGKHLLVAAGRRQVGLWASTKPKWSSYPWEDVPADCPFFLSITCLDSNALCPSDPLLLKLLKAPSCSAPGLCRHSCTVATQGLYMVSQTLVIRRYFVGL